MSTMNLVLQVWRQKNRSDAGHFERYEAKDVSEHMSFLEMLDVVNEGLVKKGDEAIAFDSDCREGICGMCSLVINGIPHGPDRGTTVCQLHMRRFKDGDTVTIEPWRARVARAAAPTMKTAPGMNRSAQHAPEIAPAAAWGHRFSVHQTTTEPMSAPATTTARRSLTSAARPHSAMYERAGSVGPRKPAKPSPPTVRSWRR